MIFTSAENAIPGHSPEDSVIITDRLRQRSYRGPNYEAENQALVALMQALASSPDSVLSLLVQTAMTLCRAQSAGVSIEEAQDGRRVFRWHAVAGGWARYVHGTMPRESSPCGTVLDRDCALLVARPHRHYPFPAEMTPPIAEALLVPFRVAGRPVGTIWVIGHDDDRTFDREDLRLMNSLSAFAGAAYQTLTTMGVMRSEVGAPRP